MTNSHFDELAKLIDEAMDRLLPAPEVQPALLHQAMRYTSLAGGKRLRGILTLAAGRAVGGEITPLLPAAVALELVHAYSLIHDDLPCMDNADLRRGMPANHLVYGEAMALLAGDALLTEAFRILAGLDAEYFGPARIVAAIGKLALAAGSLGMVGGQVDDLANVGHLDLAELDSINDRKTGALITAALGIGAVLSGATEEQVAALERYGAKIGRAFQITDDILDEIGDSGLTGKPNGSDKSAGKRTYPAIIGIEQAQAIASDLIQSAQGDLVGLPGDTVGLSQIAEYILKRNR
ncbi:MAG: polyprenyl synthetase family protein [Firmicutes bacterium]|nr:polyprenyl synthetase family protein [Bacillota bacterium]